MKGECFVGSGGRFAGAANVLSEASESLPGLRVFCRKRRAVCRGCECFVGSVGKFAGAASVLPEAAESLPEVQVVCPRRRELP